MKAKGKRGTSKPVRTVPARRRGSRAGRSPGPKAEEHWSLRLYVAGQTPRSLAAFANLKRICDQHLAGRYQIEVIDLVKQPQLAQSDQILALPTLVRKLPAPIRRVIGDLSDLQRVLVGMDLRPATEVSR